MAYLMPCDPLQMRSMYQREDSEDSDGEGGLGNVNRVLIRPPEHTGKAKKGHLCFDASFECGNLGRVDLISEYEYDLFIRPDTCSPRYRIWFNFTVDNYKQEQRVIFNIVNFSKNKLLFRNGILLPLVKSTSHPYWQRIPSKYVYYHKSQQHFNQYILSIAFAFDKEEEQIYQFSISQPYSYSRLQLYLSSLFIKKQSSSSTINITKELLTTSIQNRNVDLITINNNNVNNTKQHVIVILSRIHGSESPTSFICQGILEYLTSTQDIYILNYIRKSNIIFKIIPMLNPDGVYLGNYKTNSIGMNLNHNYDKASIFIHPTIYELIKLLKSIDTSNQYHLDFIIDLHAHFNLMGTFIYGSTYDDIYRYERHIILPKLLFNILNKYEHGSYNLLNTMYNSTDHNKHGTARRYLTTILSDSCNIYTLHVSMGGYYKNINNNNNNNIIIPYTKESYMRLGRNLIRTFIEYYKMIGVIIIDDLCYELTTTTTTNQHQSRSRSRSTYNKTKHHNNNKLKLSSPPYDIDKLRSRSLSQRERKSAINHITNIINYYNNNDTTIIQQQQQQQQYKYGSLSINNKLKTRLKSSTTTTTTIIKQQQQQHDDSYNNVVPSLSIIDFNQLTRCGIDQAIQAASSNIATNTNNTTKSKDYYSKKR